MSRRQGLSCRGLTYSPSLCSVTVHPSLSSRPGVAEASGDAYPASPIRLAAPLHSASVLLSGSLQEANRYLEGVYLFLFLRSLITTRWRRIGHTVCARIKPQFWRLKACFPVLLLSRCLALKSVSAFTMFAQRRIVK